MQSPEDHTTSFVFHPAALMLLDSDKIWPYFMGMATMTIKSTYSLDPATVQTIGDMARRLGVSKSEALRRAVRMAAGRDTDAMEALDELQRALGLSDGDARQWADRSHKERHASSAHREAARR
jgi:Arc/MetJ-type ribon-helix-helix transcriptional regulator